MEYRTSRPTNDGFHDEDDEFDAMRDYVQALMEKTEPDDICDSLLIMANLCENRAMLLQDDDKLSLWYHAMSAMMRSTLDNITDTSTVARPNEKLENQILYFPEPEVFH